VCRNRYDLDRRRWTVARSEAAPGEIDEPPPRAGHTATALPPRRSNSSSSSSTADGDSAAETRIAVFGGYNRQGLLSQEAGALALASLAADGSRLRWRLLRGGDSLSAAAGKDGRARLRLLLLLRPVRTAANLFRSWALTQNERELTCVPCAHAATPRVGHSTVGVRLNGRDCLIIFGGDSSGHAGGGSEMLDDLRLVDFTDVEAPAWRCVQTKTRPHFHTAVQI
jgi:hypothetical protein